MPLWASHRVVAFSRIGRNTGARSPDQEIDDLQHLGARGLLFERLARFVNKPRVLDCDHRLVSKNADQLDLFFAERLDSVAPQRESADRLALAYHTYDEEVIIIGDNQNRARRALRSPDRRQAG